MLFRTKKLDSNIFTIHTHQLIVLFDWCASIGEFIDTSQTDEITCLLAGHVSAALKTYGVFYGNVFAQL